MADNKRQLFESIEIYPGTLFEGKAFAFKRDLSFEDTANKTVKRTQFSFVQDMANLITTGAMNPSRKQLYPPFYTSSIFGDKSEAEILQILPASEIVNYGTYKALALQNLPLQLPADYVPKTHRLALVLINGEFNLKMSFADRTATFTVNDDAQNPGRTRFICHKLPNWLHNILTVMYISVGRGYARHLARGFYSQSKLSLGEAIDGRVSDLQSLMFAVVYGMHSYLLWNENNMERLKTSDPVGLIAEHVGTYIANTWLFLEDSTYKKKIIISSALAPFLVRFGTNFDAYPTPVMEVEEEDKVDGLILYNLFHIEEVHAYKRHAVNLFDRNTLEQRPKRQNNIETALSRLNIEVPSLAFDSLSPIV